MSRRKRDRLSVKPFLLLALLSVVAIGCGKDPEIRSYAVPKETPNEEPKAASTGAPSIGAPPKATAESVPGRMIAGIVLREGEGWFFKLFGEKKAVDAVAGDVRAFLTSLELTEDKPSDVAWTVPEGWKEGPPRPMGKLTLVLPGEGEPLAVAISTLNFGGDSDQFLHANITRWAGQLGLPAIEALDEKNGVEKLSLEGGEVWLYDAVGTKSAGGRGGMPPFAGRAAMPPATRPSPTQEPVTKFELPEGWKELPPRQMVRQVLAAGEGDEVVDIAISAYPAGAPMIDDPLLNLNRWRREVLLDPIDESDLDDHFEDIQVGGDEGQSAKMASEDGSKATHVVMVKKYDLVWFFKMKGTKSGVDAHREAFLTWAKSVRIEMPTADGTEGEE